MHTRQSQIFHKAEILKPKWPILTTRAGQLAQIPLISPVQIPIQDFPKQFWTVQYFYKEWIFKSNE